MVCIWIAIFLKWLISVSKRPLLRLDKHHSAFILTYKISYLKYNSLGRRVKRFDFSRRWNLCKIGRRVSFILLFVNVFIVFFPFYYSVDSENRQPWHDKELHNLDNIRKITQKHEIIEENIHSTND
jgi:hypothetical protein